MNEGGIVGLATGGFARLTPTIQERNAERAAAAAPAAAPVASSSRPAGTVLSYDEKGNRVYTPIAASAPAPAAAPAPQVSSTIADIYKQELGRPPDPGAVFWQNALNAGTPIEQIRAGIKSSEEGQQFATTGVPDPRARPILPESTSDMMYSPGASSSTYERGSITELYDRLLGRAPDQEGLDYWTQQLAAGANASDIEKAIRASDEYKNLPFLAKSSATYEGSRLGTPIANPDHWMLKGGEASKGLKIQQVTAGHVSNILKAATGEQPSLQDVYNVWGRVGSSAKDWDDLVQQTLKAWSDPSISQGTPTREQQYYSGLSQQLAAAQESGTPMTIGGLRDYTTQFMQANPRQAEGVTTPVTTPTTPVTPRPITPATPRPITPTAPGAGGIPSIGGGGGGQYTPITPTAPGAGGPTTPYARYAPPSFNISPAVNRYNDELAARADWEYNFFGRPDVMRPRSESEMQQLRQYQQGISQARIGAMKKAEQIAEEALNKLPSVAPSYEEWSQSQQALNSYQMPGGNYAGGQIKKYAQGGIMSAQNVPAFQAGGEMESDAFVIPADVVSALGNGSTSAGVDVLNQYLGMAMPIQGEGDGLSDDIPATIDGEQAARVADGEVYIPADVVAMLGEGNADRGAAKLYAMLDRIREAAHGKTKQQKPVNPDEVMPE
jgi:hypothetical protein